MWTVRVLTRKFFHGTAYCSRVTLQKSLKKLNPKQLCTLTFLVHIIGLMLALLSRALLLENRQIEAMMIGIQ